MGWIKYLYNHIQALSLDVAIGAIFCCMFLAKINNTIIPTNVYFALGIAVWVIYTLDHLLDAHSIQHTAHTFRHAFHQRYKKTLSSLCALLILIGLVLTFFYVPKIIFYHGVILGVLVGIYLLIINLQSLPFSTFKEFTVALIYSCGVALPVFSLSETLTPQYYLFTFTFFILAAINLLEFALFDYESDTKDNLLSAARKLGYKYIKWRINTLIILFFGMISLCYYLFWNTPLLLAINVLLLMGICLIIIYLKADFFSKDDYFRIFGDFVFLFPLLYLCL
ncbi:UbiA prenyltransferase family protein [Flammeovirga kamogawensis]|uniref:Prenyltransferase n=1 Tax=Flammeovirga kamogawensis TaxID=373891 RepID=A0ABX8GV55_9BACT|nr:hypothetical protein [Flammeovirga kamogawensis]MBB6459733.1 4-hydroxybenzoate polyprenyltransferase [Flammeovirga kamogawensis]QWG07208.1 hypothetical protein KM029_18180 [Flammeovirga kamogawensis]TRX69028.1 hypothetical protein EO216_13170 [Flammeovirga kamogawensis]